MTVKLLGIECEEGTKFTLDDFVAYLSKFNHKQIESEDVKRMYLFSNVDKDGYYVGLVVTIKKQKTLVTLKKETTGLKIVVKGMEKDSELMNYNFIIINKNTFKGFYLYPAGSYSIFALSRQMSRAWKKMAISKAKDIYDSDTKENKSGGFNAYFKRNFPNPFKLIPLVREGDFEHLFSQLTALKNAVFEFSEPRYVSRLFSGSKKYLEKHKMFITFKPIEEGEFEHAAKAILEAIKMGKPKKATIHGEEDGVIQTLQLENNIKAFETYTHDDIANRIIELELSEFENCIIFDDLINKAKQEPIIHRVSK